MDQKLYIGVDVGGTKMIASLIDAESRILKTAQTFTEAKLGKAVVMVKMHEIIREIWDTNVSGIGVGFAGLTDTKQGILIKAPNFPEDLQNIIIAQEIESEFSVPVKIENDVNCFALAEAKVGAGLGKDIIFGLTLGTGVGGGLIIDGKPYQGANGAAGEIGHTTIDFNSQQICGCGKFGHLESLASGSALIRMCKDIPNKPSNAEEIVKLAKNGDRIAISTIKTFQKALEIGFLNIIYTYNPDIVVVGGGVSETTEIWEPAAKNASIELIFPSLKTTKIVKSELGIHANVIGAALLCINC